MAYCEKCGAEIPDDSIFCEACGAKVEKPAMRPVRKEKEAETPKKGGGKTGIVIAAFLLLAVVIAAAVFLIGKGKGGGEGDETTLQAQTEITMAVPETKPSETQAAVTEAVPEKETEPEVWTTPVIEEDTIRQGTTDFADIAAELSTDEIAYATEFEWFLDLLGGGANGAAVLVTDPERAAVFTDPEGMNGGWKAFSIGEETERYFNASISTDSDKFNVTMNWKYLWLSSEGQSVDESASDLFKGTVDVNAGTATAQSDYGKVDFDRFYVSADGNAQYATGKFYWISGEIDDIALMRVKE